MAYVPLDTSKPDASAQAGTAFGASIDDNEKALRDGDVAGSTGSWTESVSGGTAEEPSIRLWSNGTLRIRKTYTWASGFPTSILVEFSSNSGSSYSTMWTETGTYDGSNNSTGGNNRGASSWMYEWIGKFKALRTTVTSLASSLYNAAAVAITGGTLNAVAITASTVKGSALGGTGATEAALATVLALHAAVIPLTPAGGGTATLDLAAADHFKITPAGNFTIALTNTPATGFSVSIILELVNCAGKTITLPAGGSWGAAGAPTFSANTDYVNVISSNGFSTSRFVFGSKG